jgi:hypothetical protein
LTRNGWFLACLNGLLVVILVRLVGNVRTALLQRRQAARKIRDNNSGYGLRAGRSASHLRFTRLTAAPGHWHDEVCGPGCPALSLSWSSFRTEQLESSTALHTSKARRGRGASNGRDGRKISYRWRGLSNGWFTLGGFRCTEGRRKQCGTFLISQSPELGSRPQRCGDWQSVRSALNHQLDRFGAGAGPALA